MYRRYAVKLHEKQVEFVNCVNITERIKKARALPSGTSHLGVERYVVSSVNSNMMKYVSMKNC
ncbi:MAG: hypothetical protein ABH844_07460 [Candidatus Omnitrophota bacterium]